ncbi:MAG: glycine cleavage system aminomethyltransferase GcvT [Candidatus Latescibacterota bacterium]|nr:glycine cleavage system aminomethyltransferase GcvT [Candidatus Latescibacterota bacterium]
MSEDLRRTPLFAVHEASGARLVPFAGWEMPVQYRGIGDEHLAVREGAGCFDVSHMGRLYVHGHGSVHWLETILPARISSMRIGQMSYSVLCAPDGGAIDDLAVYRCAKENFLLVVNASRATQDLSTLEALLPDDGSAAIEDRTTQEGMVAVQGPRALELLTDIDLVGGRFNDLSPLGFFRFRQRADETGSWLISRSGYTGEDGFEIICPASETTSLWEALVARGVLPIGLGARDTLRTEMGYPLYGHELSEQIGPVEAGLAWALALDKETSFVGQQRLVDRQQGTQRLLGLRIEGKGIPRPGYEVSQEDQVVGSVTSGTYSPSLQAGIALALVDTARIDPKRGAAIHVRNRQLPANFCNLPFVPSRVKRRRRKRTVS